MTKTNDIGQPILFETPDKGSGHFEFAQFYGGDSRPYHLSGIDRNGKITSYLGLFEQSEIRGLAKAILNAMEPESLVENQKAPDPAITPAPFNVGDRVRVIGGAFPVFPVGTIGVVSEPHTDGMYVAVDLLDTEGFPFNTHEIEHAPVEESPLAQRIDSLEARVTALEADAEPTLWGYKVGDLVKYTDTGALPGATRRVSAIHKAEGVISLASVRTGNDIGAALDATEIARA